MNDIVDDDGQSVPAIVPKPNRSLEELLGALQLVTCLQDAMMTLPRSLAEPLLLYLDDLSDADIASSLNVTEEIMPQKTANGAGLAAPKNAALATAKVLLSSGTCPI